ncbi:MAG: VOC family protein [Planctomycetes bacterium]|nr:VOC family protein [Planctomycetota bacterium]
MSDSAEAHVHHAIDYIELGATDLAAARTFYERAFGWKFTDYGPEYLGIQRAGGGEAGGLTSLCKVVTGGPLVILWSKDLDATLASVKRAGGRIVKEPFAFPGGRRFHFMDPSGNELAVWSEKGGLSLDQAD